MTALGKRSLIQTPPTRGTYCGNSASRPAVPGKAKAAPMDAQKSAGRAAPTATSRRSAPFRSRYRADPPKPVPRAMVMASWNRACGGQAGLNRWVRFQSAANPLIAVISASARSAFRPVVMGCPLVRSPPRETPPAVAGEVSRWDQDPSEEGAQPVDQRGGGPPDELGEVAVLVGEGALADAGVHGSQHGRELLGHSGALQDLDVLLRAHRPVDDVAPQYLAERG